jgi:hypothetical protein
MVAHPSHETRLHGWLETVSPRVYILTDGSGLSGTSTIAGASAYVEQVGAKPGSVFGRFTDLVLYRAILNQDLKLFYNLTDELAGEIIEKQFDYVVGDAMEGYNPVHDVCRIVVDCAIQTARKHGRNVRNYDYAMFELPKSGSADLEDQSIVLSLDDEMFKRKIDSARKYYPELVEELETAIRVDGSGRLRDYLDASGQAASSVQAGLEMYRTECLRLVNDSAVQDWPERPFYEDRSEAHVFAGHFDRAIKFRDHMQPLATALRLHFANVEICES